MVGSGTRVGGNVWVLAGVNVVASVFVGVRLGTGVKVLVDVAVIVGVQVGGRNLANVGVGEAGIAEAGEQPANNKIIRTV
jgi:hypothetical protein